MSEAETADQYEALYIIGWRMARHDGQKPNGYFRSTHYPIGTPEFDGYTAFVRAVRERSAA